MKTKTTALLAGAIASCLTLTASASVVEIGEFVGDVFENFEGIAAPGPIAGGMPIFGGTATFDDFYSDPWITTVLSSPDINIFAYDGNYMGLAPTGWTRWTFETPVYKFGGYFATTFQGADGRVRFLDDQGNEIDTLAFSTEAGQWSWHGWQSTVGIAVIEIQSDVNPGLITVFDNMQASMVPAPGAMTLLVLGFGFTRRRRG